MPFRSCLPTILAASLIGLFFSSLGCRSTQPSIDAARHAYSIGDLETAGQTLSGLADGPKRTRYESQLDLAMVDLARGDAPAAESRLRELRDHFDSLPNGGRISAASINDAVSLATDDNARVFQIADYEQVLLRSMLAICSLAGDAVDAEAYCLQAQSRQMELSREIEDDSPDQPEDEQASEGQELNQPPSQLVALAPYLRGTLREATHQNYDDAERAFRLVSNIQPEFSPAAHDIQRVSEGVHSQTGHGVLYVFAFVGHGPRLVETVAPTTTASLQIASTILQAVENNQQGNDGDLILPNIASVKVPVVEIPPSELAAIGVSIRGEFLGATQMLTDIGLMALQKSEAEMPWTIARAVARRVVKETSVAATSNTLGLSGNAATVFKFAAVSAWSGTEHADTRCWGLLPREIQVLRAELPVGSQNIDLLPMSPSGEIFAESMNYSVMIEDGRNHYLIVIAPEQILSVVH